MRLTLDWDTEQLKEIHFPRVRERTPYTETQARLGDYVGLERSGGDKWELWRSSSHGMDETDEKGYHYIEYGLNHDLDSIRNVRQAFGDDRTRVIADEDRVNWGSPYPQVMYHYKQIKPGDLAPYDTPYVAELVERHGFGTNEEATDEFLNSDGTIDYPTLIEELAAHPDFGNRAALFRRIQERDSVDITTRPSARAHDLVHEREGRTPTQAEKKALRDYAMSRDLGHYVDGKSETPGSPLDDLPTRTVFHESLPMIPDIELDAENFGETDGAGAEADAYLSAGVRTGTYGDVNERLLKEIHDRIVPEVLDILSPGFYQTDKWGTRQWQGIELPRLNHAISLEQNRPIDPDEKALTLRNFLDEQPGTSRKKIEARLERQGITPTNLSANDSKAVMWEVVVWDEDYSGYWWIVRGVINTEEKDVRSPIKNSAIVCDTMGWL